MNRQSLASLSKREQRSPVVSAGRARTSLGRSRLQHPLKEVTFCGCSQDYIALTRVSGSATPSLRMREARPSIDHAGFGSGCEWPLGCVPPQAGSGPSTSRHVPPDSLPDQASVGDDNRLPLTASVSDATTSITLAPCRSKKRPRAGARTSDLSATDDVAPRPLSRLRIE